MCSTWMEIHDEIFNCVLMWIEMMIKQTRQCNTTIPKMRQLPRLFGRGQMQMQSGTSLDLNFLNNGQHSLYQEKFNTNWNTLLDNSLVVSAINLLIIAFLLMSSFRLYGWTSGWMALGLPARTNFTEKSRNNKKSIRHS